MTIETSRGRFGLQRTGSDGTPVLLLHPLALAGAFWDPMARHLAGQHQVLAMDARGHGASEWDGAPFTIEDLAADTAAVIEAVVQGPCHVVGLSMGGCTAIVLAATRPDLVRRLVLADTTASYGPHRVEHWADRARQAEDVPREKQLEFQGKRWFTDRFRTERPTEADRVEKIFLATSSAAHAAACRALGAFDGTRLLPDIHAQTLVLVGEEDYATTPAMARALADGIPGARLRILDQTRHFSLIERPDLWPAVADHLAG